MLTYIEIKRLIYILETALGLIAAAVAMHLFFAAPASAEPALLILPAGVLLIVGLTTILFGGVTYLIRDDEDVWR